MSMKNVNDTTGNRTRKLPACSAVPEPTAPRRAPLYARIPINYNEVSLFDFFSRLHIMDKV